MSPFRKQLNRLLRQIASGQRSARQKRWELLKYEILDPSEKPPQPPTRTARKT